MSNDDESFGGRLYIAGPELTCHVGFEYLENTSYLSGPAETLDHLNTVPTSELPVVPYLCANTCVGTSSAYLYFKYVGDKNYQIWSRDQDFYNAYVLSIDSGYLKAYKWGELHDPCSGKPRPVEWVANRLLPVQQIDVFNFVVNGKKVMMSEMTGGLVELHSQKGGLQFHKKKVLKYSVRDCQWAAYFATYDGDAGVVGCNIEVSR